MDNNPYHERLVNAAIRFMSYRPRSEKELRDFLTKKLTTWQVSGSMLISKVIARMGELGYVGDVKFASWWVEQRQAFRPKGREILKRELAQKGIDRATIDTVLSADNQSEEENARKVALKKISLLGKLPKPEQKKKLWTFLARRGFDTDTIGRIVDDMVASRVQ